LDDRCAQTDPRIRDDGDDQWCIAKNGGAWVYAKGRGEGPEGTLLI